MHKESFQEKRRGLWLKAVSDSSHFLVSNIIIKALSFIVIPFLTRNLSIEEFAVYDLFLMLSSMLLVLLMMGMDSGLSILIAERGEDQEKLSFLLVFNLFISLLLAVIAWALSLPIFFLFNVESLSFTQWNFLFAYLCATLVTSIVFNFTRWVGLAKLAAYLNLFCACLGVCVALCLFYYNRGVSWYIGGLLAGSLVGAFFSLYLVRRYLAQFRFESLSTKNSFEILKLSLPFVPNYLGNTLIHMSDRLIILSFMDLKFLGIYALFSRIAALPNIFVTIVSSGFMPVLMKNYSSDLGKRFVRQVFHCYLFLLPFCLFIFLSLDRAIVDLFGGDKYVAHSYLVMPMVAVAFMNASTYINGLGFLIKRKTQHVTYITFISLAINLSLSTFLVFQYGLTGVVVASLFAAAIRMNIYAIYSERLYSFSYSLPLLIIVTLLVFFLSIVAFSS